MGATIDVLDASERVEVMMVELVMEELTLDKLETVGTCSVEHTAWAGKEGKTDSLRRGRGRVGFSAVPSILPSPGKLLAEAAKVVGAAADTAGALAGLAAKAAALAAW